MKMNFQFIRYYYATAEQKIPLAHPKTGSSPIHATATNDNRAMQSFGWHIMRHASQKTCYSEPILSFVPCVAPQISKNLADGNGEGAKRLAYSRCRCRPDYAGSLRNIPEGISVSSFTGSNSKPWGAASRATSSRLTVCHVYSAWLSRTTLPSRTI